MTTRNEFRFLNSIALVILLWLMAYAAAFSQSYLFDTEVINVEDGLPSRRVYDITQDNEGFIWVSTPGAISRYDGYTFKTYARETLGITEDNLCFLAADDQNRVWYCSITPENIYYQRGGVMNAQRDSVYRMGEISGRLFTTTDIVALHNFKANGKTVCIATRQGMVYKYEKGRFEEIYRFPRPVSPPLNCEMTSDGGYWITHNMEVIKVKNKKRVQTIRIDGSYTHIKRIVSTIPDLILSFYDTLPMRYRKLEGRDFVPYTTLEKAPDTIKKLIWQNKDYSIYTASDALLVRDRRGKLLHRFNDFEFSSPAGVINLNKVFSDRQDILWIATENGLFKIKVSKNPFDILQAGNSIRGIYRDGNKLWTGGYYGNFIHHLDSKTTASYTNGHYAVMSFYKDSNGHIWMGTDTGKLLQYSPETDQYSHYIFDNDNNNTFHLLLQDPVTGKYWLGSNEGLFRFYKKDTAMTLFDLPVPSDNLQIRQFYQHKEGLWVVSNKGLFLLDPQKENLIKHYTLKDGFPVINLNHIYEDARGVFWVGTRGGGLLRWERTSNTITQYTRSDGLSDNTVYAVYEDDYQTLWLPGNNGLMAFDKTTRTTKVYLPQNGIAHKEFNTFAHFKDKDGRLYFGGLGGITRFHPGALHENTGISPPIHVTRVQVLEKDAEQYTDKTGGFLNAKELRLGPDDQVLEVELALLDYEKSAENQYAYKFSGQQRWIYTDNNTLSIINPPSGRYDLIIKARGASGDWSEKTLNIPIYRPPPFYRRWWFLLTMAAVVATGIIIIIKQRERILRQDRKRLEAEVKKRTHQIEKDKQLIEAQAEDLKALDKAKMRFFTNITHELRTPLTLILGPAEQLLTSRIPKPFRTLAQTIKNNAGHLLELINQLLDVSRLESGQMQVKASTADVIAFSRKLAEGVQPLADKKKQKLIFTPELLVWKTHFDLEKFGKIVYNLLSNAIKYTPEYGHIELSVFKKEDGDNVYIGIRVKDTGIGIAADVLPHIFDRFYQADDSNTRKAGSTGIGLALVKELITLQNGSVHVESTLGIGSIFTVQFPVLPALEATNRLPESVTADNVPPESVLAEFGIENNHKENPDRYVPGEKLELLIVEDHPEMRTYIRSCIGNSVYNITEAGDGEEGIAKAIEIVPDLIISDVMMPKKDGFELTHAIRSHLATSHIPLILLTAKASLESRLKGLERGADAYLPKPFSPEELVLRIQKLIELRRLLQARYQNNIIPEGDTTFVKEDQFIIKLRAYIQEYINEPNLGGETISRHFAMSRMQLYRKLKAVASTTISSYIQHIRLEKAMQLLKEQQLNATEVAYVTGFSSLSYFSKMFIKKYGKKPSEFL